MNNPRRQVKRLAKGPLAGSQLAQRDGIFLTLFDEYFATQFGFDPFIHYTHLEL